MKKKILSVLLMLCLVIGFLPMAASADYIGTAGEWYTVPGIEGGEIKFDKETCAITDSRQSITSADIPGTIDGVAVKKIGQGAFYLCEMTHLTLPEGLQVIEARAFSECWQLEGSVAIPESVTTIGEEAFRGVCTLTAIEVAPGNGAYCSVDGVLFSKDRSTLVAYPGGKGSTYEIPAGTTKIMPGVFACSLDLTDVTIPNGITEIDTEVFYDCMNLARVTIPSSVVRIGDYAFRNTAFTEFAIPEGVTEIGEGAFDYCENLTGVTLPSSLAKLGAGVFSNCEKLTAIEVAPGNRTYCAVDGVLFSKDMKMLVECPVGKTGAYEIPNGVTTIGAYAFFSCAGLTDITVPKGVTRIGEGAFSFCAGLTGIVLPKGVTEIEKEAFSYCYGLTSMVVPNGVTQIGDDAFASCGSLTSITFPKSLTQIGEWAFSNVQFLTDVYYAGTQEQWNAITIGFANQALEDATIHYESGITEEEPDPVKQLTPDMIADIPEVKYNGKPHTPVPTIKDGNTVLVKDIDYTVTYSNNIDVGTATVVITGKGNYSGTVSKSFTIAPAPSVPATSVETAVTEDGNTVTTTTQPGGDKEIEVKTPAGETVAKVNLPADPGAGKKFEDVKAGEWYVEAVDSATAYGLFNGTSDTTFSPNDAMTRGMLAQTLYNLSGKTSYGVGEGSFTDVKDGAWYENAVDWAAKAGVTSGTGNGGFSPEQNITREQLVTMLYRYAKVIGADMTAGAGLEQFPDGGQVSGWAQEAMQWAVAKGFISGRSNGGVNYISSQGITTRAETAAVLTRFVEYLK